MDQFLLPTGFARGNDEAQEMVGLTNSGINRINVQAKRRSN